MLEGDAGAPVQEAPAAVDPALAVGDPPSGQGKDAGSSTATPKLPGWTGQLTKEQLADIQDRSSKDPKALEELPKGLSELYQSYTSLKAQAVGALKRPAQDAPKEAWDQFYKELGRPESAEGYTLEKPEVPSGMRYDEDSEKWFRSVAYDLGLTNEQARSFYDNWNKTQTARVQKANQARQQAATEAMNSLKAEYKDKFPDVWEGIRQAYTQFIPEGQNGALFKKIHTYGLDNDPDFLRMFHNIYKKIGPPKMVVPSGQGGGSGEKGGFNFNVGGIGRS